MRHYHVLETIDALRRPPGDLRGDPAATASRSSPPAREGREHQRRRATRRSSSPTAAAGPAASRETLAELGIDRPFVLNVGGLDARKNTWKLIDAFAALPERLRETHQLVLTFAIDDWGREAVLEHAARCGLEDSLVLTGEVSDETLRVLYQRCDGVRLPVALRGVRPAAAGGDALRRRGDRREQLVADRGRRRRRPAGQRGRRPRHRREAGRPS